MTKQNKIFLLLGATAACVTVALLLNNKKEKGLTNKIVDKGHDLADRIVDLIGKGKKQAQAMGM